MADKKNLKVSPEEEDEFKRLFKEGLDEAGKDPDKHWETERDKHNNTKPYPSLKEPKPD